MKPTHSRSLMIKICGITRLEDAVAAIHAGADLLGFIFYASSPRAISPSACKTIVAELALRKLRAGLVGVFVNTPPGEILAVLQECGLHIAQLAGDEPPEDLPALAWRAYKVLRPADADELEQALARYPRRPFAPAWLLDAARPGAYGGTGQRADWNLAAPLAARAPILLAGGLTPENVAEAVRQVQPWGVDVASGVETAPGVKDHGQLQRFIANARSAG